MAKRAPAGEAAYNPLDGGLAQSVIKPAGFAQDRRASPVGMLGEGDDQNARLGPHGVHNGAPQAIAQSRGLTRAKRVLLTPDEERHIERLVDRLAEHVGASLKLSHVLRACMTVLCHAEAEIMRHASSLDPLVRPANGDAVALAQFEQGISRLISEALRDAPPLRYGVERSWRGE